MTTAWTKRQREILELVREGGWTLRWSNTMAGKSKRVLDLVAPDEGAFTRFNQSAWARTVRPLVKAGLVEIQGESSPK